MDTILENAVVVITGARGVGKSWLAATYLPPNPDALARVFYHDSERSGNRAVQELGRQGLGFGHYGDLQARFGDLPDDNDLLSRLNRGELPWVNKAEKHALIGYYRYVLDGLDKHLIRGQYDVYILDTLGKLEAGMVAYVEENIKDFGYLSIAKARQWAKIWNDCVYPLYEHLISAIFHRGVKTIILCSHLGSVWADKKQVVGKVKPKGKPLLYRLSSLMIWLVNDWHNADGAPAGLVLKERLGQLEAVDGKWKPRRMLPQRIPHCTWDDIKRYLKDGCDLANPAEGEQMTDSEQEMTSEFLTNEQMRLMVLGAETELERIRQESAPILAGAQAFALPTAVPKPAEVLQSNSGMVDLIQRVKELSLNGSASSIKAELAEYPEALVDYAIQQVLGT